MLPAVLSPVAVTLQTCPVSDHCSPIPSKSAADSQAGNFPFQNRRAILSSATAQASRLLGFVQWHTGLAPVAACRLFPQLTIDSLSSATRRGLLQSLRRAARYFVCMPKTRICTMRSGRHVASEGAKVSGGQLLLSDGLESYGKMRKAAVVAR